MLSRANSHTRAIRRHRNLSVWLGHLFLFPRQTKLTLAYVNYRPPKVHVFLFVRLGVPRDLPLSVSIPDGRTRHCRCNDSLHYLLNIAPEQNSHTPESYFAGPEFV